MHPPPASTATVALDDPLSGFNTVDQRLRLVLSILIPVAAVYSLIYLAVFFATGIARLLPTSLITMALFGAFVRARHLSKAGRFTEAALWVGYSLAAAPVGFATLIPFAYPTMVMMPLAAGALMIGYVRGLALARFLIVCGLSCLLSGFVGTTAEPETAVAPWVVWIILYGTICVSVVVILGLLWLSSRRLNEIMARLRLADRFKDDFLSVLGHELRTPLASVANASSLLESGAGGDGHLPGMIRTEAQHMARLLDDLLDVTRVKHGTLGLQMGAVDLSEVVARVVASARAQVALSGHLLAFEAVGGVVSVRGDEVRLVQVVSNLLTNAIRYTPRGGTITVRLTATQTEAVIAVQDTGMGFTGELRTHIFEPFVQGPPLPDQLSQGLGIGLALVQQLVERHQGTVRALSDGPGLGALFEVQLPRIREASPLVVARTASPQAVPTSARVLVVDDRPNAAITLAMMVETWGHQTRTAFDAPAALELAESWQPEVVLLDLGLPSMDGVELGRLLRERLGPSLVMFAVTGYGSEQHRERTRGQGFSGYFLKPVRAAELSEALERALSARGQLSAQK
ncbi:MAG: multi-sensor hybrid histidine kinase [Myxococcaceae bacterium]|nr:multi-sensor hybrid histidine kinase [Myxococcaceae bacterium]